MDWQIFGHDWAVNLLNKHLANEQLHHAYLFSGPDGIGRRTLALRFAQAINCENKDEQGNPCGECRICRQTMEMKQPDLSIIECAEGSNSIKVDQIRELQHLLSLTPFEAQYRISLLLDFEQATTSAQNALLKTLEEAPKRVVLLLTVDAIENVLPTISSRCEIMRLRPMNVQQLSAALESHWKMDTSNARLLAQVSGGRLGEALRYAQEPELLEKRKRYLDDLMTLIGQDRVDRLMYAEKQFRHNRNAFSDALQIWLSFWRDVMVKSIGEEFFVNNLDYENEIKTTADDFGHRTAREQAANIQQALYRLDRNVNVWLLAEVLLLDLPEPARG
ncbi:MAG: DNA polymerase III subunit [Anaerolineaceae bacterium]|nr:DNA polymerase III subunit [Anaerolineaceae bacterium]